MKKHDLPENEKPMMVAEVAAVYGMTDDGGIYTIIDKVNSGISFRLFENIIRKYSFSIQNWADFLHVSTKTLSRYQKESKTFDALQSERILQIEMLHQRGEEVFGSRENFAMWLDTENLALGKRIPKDLLKNVFGIQLLNDELTRIEYGVLS